MFVEAARAAAMHDEWHGLGRRERFQHWQRCQKAQLAHTRQTNRQMAIQDHQQRQIIRSLEHPVKGGFLARMKQHYYKLRYGPHLIMIEAG